MWTFPRIVISLAIVYDSAGWAAALIALSALTQGGTASVLLDGDARASITIP